MAVGDVEVGNFTGRLHHPGFRGSTRVVSDVGSGMSSTPRPKPRVPALFEALLENVSVMEAAMFMLTRGSAHNSPGHSLSFFILK